MGPLLFLTYVNDVNHLNVNTKAKLYADDLVLYSTEKDPKIAYTNVQHDLDRLTGWCKLDKMTINAKKIKSNDIWNKRHAGQI